MLTVFAAALGICCLYPLILSLYGEVPFLLTYSYIFIFFLMGAAFIAIGMFLSTLTSNQFIAAAISFCALLFFYMLEGISSIISSTAFASLMAFSIMALLLALILWYMNEKPRCGRDRLRRTGGGPARRLFPQTHPVRRRHPDLPVRHFPVQPVHRRSQRDI